MNRQIPVVFVEPHPDVKNSAQLIEELLETAASKPLTAYIRHNSKIFREKLAVTAREKLRQSYQSTANA